MLLRFLKSYAGSSRGLWANDRGSVWGESDGLKKSSELAQIIPPLGALVIIQHTYTLPPKHPTSTMACIASTFTGSVAALKASKVQVRVARSPSPSRPFFRPLPPMFPGKSTVGERERTTRVAHATRGSTASRRWYIALRFSHVISPTFISTPRAPRIPAMDVILRVAASTRFRDTSIPGISSLT